MVLSSVSFVFRSSAKFVLPSAQVCLSKPCDCWSNLFLLSCTIFVSASVFVSRCQHVDRNQLDLSKISLPPFCHVQIDSLFNSLFFPG